jgi:type IX secretion system PorP/SprF family membrane protein
MKHLVPMAILCLQLFTLNAQDTDPFFAGRSTTWLNPSRAGFQPGTRISFIHQDQWMQFPGSWKSELLSADLCARNTRKQVRSWLGAGLNVEHEVQGVSSSRMSSVGLLPAMHLRTGKRTYLSAGLEVRWTNGSFGDALGAWGSQYDGSRYDTSLPSGEQWTTSNSSWVEPRAGLSFTMKRDVERLRRQERDILVVGISADHLARLVLYEGGSPAPTRPMKFTIHAMGELPHEIWDDGFFAAEVIAHYQGPFHTGRVNLFAGKHLMNRSREPGGTMPLGFKAGVGYRAQDAFLVSTAIDLNTTTIGLAYGWSLFNPNTLATGRRTVELLLQIHLGG